MVAGYIYVLVNSSMPGLIKVGKTARDPTQRIAELSGATGVATPFVLAFKQRVEDCDTAEFYVHRALEARGHRVSSSREFFRAEIDEVIHLVIESAKLSPGLSESKSLDDDADLLIEFHGDEFALPEQRPISPWDSILEDADNLNYGVGDEIEDPARALGLYKDAIRLGCLVAYERIGSIFEYGRGVSENEAKALDYYRTGAEKGNYYCWACMASLFHSANSDANATKCWKRFFDLHSLKQNISVEENDTKFWDALCDCCVYCMLNNEHSVLLQYLQQHSSLISEHCDERIRYCKGVERVNWFKGVKSWLLRI